MPGAQHFHSKEGTEGLRLPKTGNSGRQWRTHTGICCLHYGTIWIILARNVVNGGDITQPTAGGPEHPSRKELICRPGNGRRCPFPDGAGDGVGVVLYLRPYPEA